MLGKKHREVVQPWEEKTPEGGMMMEPDKEKAKLERSKRVQAVRAARKAGQLSCPRCIPTVANKPVLFGELLEDLLRRRDLKARDDHERQLRRRKEQARVSYLRARLGARPVVSITSRDIETFYAALKARQVGEGEQARPLATSTINHHIKLLRSVLRLGVRRGVLLTNPANAVELARENNARNRCLNDEEEARLWVALPEWFKPLVAVAIHTGMRRGELLGLRWTDVDLTSSTVTLKRDKAGTGRWVTLNSKAVEALRAIKRDRAIMSQLVFCTPEGKSLRTNFGRYWRGVLAKANVPDFRFHDLRHTFASRLAMDGVDLYTVQRAGGWKTSVMVQRYAHLSPEHIRAAVERLAHRPVNGNNGHQNGHQAAKRDAAGAAVRTVTA